MCSWIGLKPETLSTTQARKQRSNLARSKFPNVVNHSKSSNEHLPTWISPSRSFPLKIHKRTCIRFHFNAIIISSDLFNVWQHFHEGSARVAKWTVLFLELLSGVSLIFYSLALLTQHLTNSWKSSLWLSISLTVNMLFI